MENIVGYGIMEKIVNGDQRTGKLAFTLLVKEKLPKEDVHPQAFIPPTLPGGVLTDVQEVGDARPYSLTQRLRPAPCGSAVGHGKVTAGTLGAVVVLNGGDDGNPLCILSNNHILANSGWAQIGDPIYQPGPAFGGQDPNNVIATLYRAVPLKFVNPVTHQGDWNYVDAAVAWTGPDFVSPVFGNDAVNGYTIDPNPNLQPYVGMMVRKIGMRTGQTLGRIVGTQNFPAFPYDYRGDDGQTHLAYANIAQQLVIHGFSGPFSQPGDSGSLALRKFLEFADHQTQFLLLQF